MDVMQLEKSSAFWMFLTLNKMHSVFHTVLIHTKYTMTYSVSQVSPNLMVLNARSALNKKLLRFLLIYVVYDMHHFI